MFALVWIHLLAAVVWVGGMVFLSVVLVPVLRRDGGFARHAELFRTAAYRFRLLVWGAMGTLVATGASLAVGRAIPLTAPSQWPPIFMTKIGLVALLFTLTLLHDLVVGPRVRRIPGTPEATGSAWGRLLVRYSVLVPRLSLFVALLVLLAAVVLART